MKIIVKAKTRCKLEKVERVSQEGFNFGGRETNLPVFKVWVKEAPVAGSANQAITKALAKYFKVAPSQVELVSGATAKQKIFHIAK